MKDYILHILKEDKQYRFKLTYKNGKFHRLERLAGYLSYKQHIHLMNIVPQTEDLIPELAERYRGSLLYESVKKESSLHAVFIDKYCEWYYNRFQIEPIIKPQDAQAIKFIKNALVKLSGYETEAITVWEMILNNWDNQDKWYISQTEITQIKRNLNIILKTLKHGKSTQETGKTARNVSDDYRQNL